MTVYMYTGTVGSGKSLHAASEIRHYLNAGRPVIGNFELSDIAPVRSRESYTYLDNEDLTPALLMKYSRDYFAEHEFRENWLVLVVDECQILWNSRTWQQKGNNRQEWLSFFSQSRKWGYKVILIAQSDLMIDNQMRMQVEYKVQHRKLSNFGFWGWLIGTLFMGRLFLYITTYYVNGEVLERQWYVARHKDMAMYDTTKKFEMV